MPTGKDDLTTLLSAHIATLRAVSSQAALDVSTTLTKDVPTMEATESRVANDTNADYFVYLQSNP